GTNTPSVPLPSRTSALLARLHLPPNLGTLAAATYSTLYLLLSPNAAGLSATPFIMGMAAASNRLQQRYPAKKLNGVAAGLHVVSWILQFVGHGLFEGRKPALLDNLVQALFLAPLFVWYEGLFRLGFYGGLRREVESGVRAEMERIGGKGEGKGKEGEGEGEGGGSV
ncbi:hypothetical protein BDW02DRAFT_503681, partial [Decorospora gaudefroyi]